MGVLAGVFVAAPRSEIVGEGLVVLVTPEIASKLLE